MMKHSSHTKKDHDIGSRKISVFGIYGKFGWSLPQNYAFCFMICTKDYFFWNILSFYHDITIGGHGDFNLSQKSSSGANGKFMLKGCC